MPSFQPTNGSLTEVSTMAGRTTAIGRPAPYFAISDSARLLVKRVGVGPSQLGGALHPASVRYSRSQRKRFFRI